MSGWGFTFTDVPAFMVTSVYFLSEYNCLSVVEEVPEAADLHLRGGHTRLNQSIPEVRYLWGKG